MAESNTVKFDAIYKLLTQYSFKLDKNIPDKLKCERCNKLIIDPCQVRCLCKFCRNCIDTMIKIGIDKCPGNKAGCKDEQLSTFVSHYETNNQISKLVLKCPEQMCSHKCELMKMEGHLNVCSKKIAECPFCSLGCTDDKLVTDKMNDHLMLEGYKHNKILMEYLRNEFSLLKQSDETNKEDIRRSKIQIDILLESNKLKDRMIEFMSEEIRRNKLQIEVFKEKSPSQIETIIMLQEEIQRNKDQIAGIVKDTSMMKDETIAVMNKEIERSNDPIEVLKKNSKLIDETIAVVQDEIRLIKMDYQEMLVEINYLKTESQNKFNHSKDEIKKESPGRLGVEISKMAKQIVELENWLGIQNEGSFLWKVDQVSYKNLKGTDSCSPIFYPRNHPYKLQLRMHNGAGKDEFEIWFRVHSSDKDVHLKWPLQGNVTIKIINHVNPAACKSISKSCNIPQPNSSSHHRSDKFKFSYTELSTTGLMLNNYFIVECCIE